MILLYALGEWVCLTLSFLLLPLSLVTAFTFDGLTKAREYFRQKRKEAQR